MSRRHVVKNCVHVHAFHSYFKLFREHSYNHGTQRYFVTIIRECWETREPTHTHIHSGYTGSSLVTFDYVNYGRAV